MNKIGVTSSGTVIVEMSQAQFAALSALSAAPPAAIKPEPETAKVLSLKEKIEYVRPRLAKLKPRKKDGVTKSISAMFQFTGGIEDADIDRIISALAKEGFLSVGPTEKIEYKEK